MDKVVVKGAAIRPKDETPEEMAKTILDILDHPEKITEMSQNAFKNRVSVLQSSQIKKLLSVYELAISKNLSSNR
jgi:UDP-N-acetylglucosamine:LPS N-acetylglucosamine transferase